MQQILAGKKISIPTWQLTVVATPVVSVNDKVLSADMWNAQFSHNMHPADDLKVEIVYNDTTVDSLKFLKNQIQKTTHTLSDTQELADHTYKFIISGKNNNHNYLTKTKDSVTWLIKLEVYLENLSVTGLLTENATIEDFWPDFYVGKNGTYTLKIQTPIYGWLLQHDDWIVKQEILIRR